MNTIQGSASQSMRAERQPPGEDPTVYQIRVKGTIGPKWSDWFGGMEIASMATGETVLIGPVADQAALHGIVARLRDLNLPLISLTRVTEDGSWGKTAG